MKHSDRNTMDTMDGIVLLFAFIGVMATVTLAVIGFESFVSYVYSKVTKRSVLNTKEKKW